MALRARRDGRILCAAMHEEEEPGDIYINDGEHYRLSVELGLFVTEPMEADPENPGLGGHKEHGEWWLRGKAPDDAVLEDRPERQRAESPVYFFGCTKGAYGDTQAGHYFYVEGPNHERRPRQSEWLGEGIIPKTDIHIDGGFCPHYAREKGYAKARLTHLHGWTVIGFWDSSGDTRPGSDSNFWMKGTLSFEDALAEARRAFGPVIDRCEKKYGSIELVQTVAIP